jgi:hypothetical protein
MVFRGPTSQLAEMGRGGGLTRGLDRAYGSDLRNGGMRQYWALTKVNGR